MIISTSKCKTVHKYFQIMTIRIPYREIGKASKLFEVCLIFASDVQRVLSKYAWAAITKYHSLGDLNNRIYLLIVLEAGSSRSDSSRVLLPVRTFFQACRWHPSFSTCLHVMGMGQRDLIFLSFF